MGPGPIVTPATTDNAAAAAAPDAMRRLRTKNALGDARTAGATARAEGAGRGRPNVRDAKTSSKVA